MPPHPTQMNTLPKRISNGWISNLRVWNYATVGTASSRSFTIIIWFDISREEKINNNDLWVRKRNVPVFVGLMTGRRPLKPATRCKKKWPSGGFSSGNYFRRQPKLFTSYAYINIQTRINKCVWNYIYIYTWKCCVKIGNQISVMIGTTRFYSGRSGGVTQRVPFRRQISIMMMMMINIISFFLLPS